MHFYADPDAFVPDTSFGYLSKRIFQLSSQRLEPVFAAAGTTNLQWSVLVTVWLGQGVTCAELARAIAHDAGATTRVLDTLEEKGWIERTRSRDDRRVVRLALTPAGDAVAQACRGAVQECWNAWLAEWSRDDAATLLRLLQRLRGTLETTEAECA